MNESLTKHIDWDLVKIPIQIKTSSTLGSGNLIGIDMYDGEDDDDYFGGIGVKFGNNRFKYWLDDFTVQPSNKVDKIWTFTITETAVIIDCNGVELLNYQFSDSSHSDTCKDWVERECKYIKFREDYNTASDSYRAEPLESGNRLEKNQVLLTPNLLSYKCIYSSCSYFAYNRWS